MIRDAFLDFRTAAADAGFAAAGPAAAACAPSSAAYLRDTRRLGSSFMLKCRLLRTDMDLLWSAV
eukprot:CAMPEP_0115691824 /NCGR_PEP_ID=MMETSP0272-20121206/62863_1 /TAXON_ID=71861 /ORGANISM="Scrippsiella trochoidea, Strain CCMP3099" /LENGTH=64 /DNA_ID=CAMNT_0003131831 /DNA_START=75 /DNA_END=269 /DNA_ORIENTATION=+